VTVSLERLPTLLALVCVATSGTALAVTPGGTLYIKAKNTHLKASSSPTADTLVVLQPGQKVTFEGREKGLAHLCRVKAEVEKKGSFTGLIYQANLSLSPPSLEVLSKDPTKPLSPEAFASSGAAIKALGPGAIVLGKTLPKVTSAEQLAALVQLAHTIDDAQVAEYARAGGLPEVVGMPEVVSPPEVASPPEPAPQDVSKEGGP
jgi:hypothetical protein